MGSSWPLGHDQVCVEGCVQGPVRGGVGGEQLSRVVTDLLVHLVADALSQWRALDLVGDGGVDGRCRVGAGLDAAGRDGETGRLHQRRQFVEAAADEVAAHQRQCFGAGVAGGDVEERRERDLSFELARDEQANRASLLGDSAHLAQRGGAVRDEHERHLAEHDVEGLLVERERAQRRLGASRGRAGRGGQPSTWPRSSRDR